MPDNRKKQAASRMHVPGLDRAIDPPLLTPAMLVQLRSYVRARDDGTDSGWYYGNRAQFEARHTAILEWLDALERTK